MPSYTFVTLENNTNMTDNTLTPAVAEAIRNLSVTATITRQVDCTCSVTPDVFCNTMGRTLYPTLPVASAQNQFKTYFLALNEDAQLALIKLFESRLDDTVLETGDTIDEEISEEITLDEWIDSYSYDGWRTVDTILCNTENNNREWKKASDEFKDYADAMLFTPRNSNSSQPTAQPTDEVTALREELDDLKRKHALLVAAVQSLHAAHHV